VSSDVILVILGAWIHQFFRVAYMLFCQPEALRTATSSDRRIVANPFKANRWSDGLSADDRAQLERFKKKFSWEFYVFLLMPMVVLIVWAISR
jgi:hypothetical protein